MGAFAGGNYVSDQQLEKTQLEDLLVDLELLLNSGKFNEALEQANQISDLLKQYYTVDGIIYKNNDIESVHNDVSSIYQYFEKVFVQEIRDKISSL